MTHSLVHTVVSLAQATPAQSGGGPFGQFGSLVPMVAIFAIFYFLIIRPNSRKQKEHQQMLSELKKGDEVVTQGGIIGKISGLTDKEITLQIQEGVRIRVTRASVQGLYGAVAAAKPDSKAS
ncbi:MAG TPA: preprotein translocase subunit YajC [Polyangia bacterium]|nr:preprotein translocase subunit YajC [Polyangia bacterium]